MSDDDKPRRRADGTFEKGSTGNATGRAGRTYMDGWKSAMMGLGTAEHDKRMSVDFVPPQLSYQQLIDMVEGDDLAERAVKAPIDDATRQGYEISIADEGDFDDLKAGVEDKLRKWDVDKVIKRALYQKRALGGSAILLGVRDYKPMSAAIDQDNLSNLEFLSVLEPMMLQPYLWYENPAEPKYGEVKIWQVAPQATGFGAQGVNAVKTAATESQAKDLYYIHETRLIVLNNDKISAYSCTRNEAGDYWGLSILVKLYEILRDFNISWASAGLIVSDFSQGVFSIEGLANIILRDEDKLIARMRALTLGRSTARSIVIDKEHEDFRRESTNVSGLPDLLNQLSRRLAAAIDIPLSVLMGGGEKTDKAEMTNELRYYYDKCVSIQQDEIGPLLRFFIQVAMRGLRQRGLPKKWTVKWHPLWQLTDEQKANARLAQARVDAIYIEHGVLDPQVVAMLRFGGEYSFDTALPSSYQAPGFMALPPMGVLVDGMDPTTGLPPGVQPPPPTPGAEKKPPPNKVFTGAGNTGAHAVAGYTRRNPAKKNMAKSNYSQAGGATPGKLTDSAESVAARSGQSTDRADMKGQDGHCVLEHDSVSAIAHCEHCSKCEDCSWESAANLYASEMDRLSREIAAQTGEEPMEDGSDEHCRGMHEDGIDICSHCVNCDACKEKKS